MAEYYVVRDKNTGLYFRGKGVNRWGKHYNQASIYRIKANAENTIKEVSWRGEQAEVVPIQIIENTADVVPKSEYDAVVSAVDNSTKEFLKLHDDYQEAKREIDKWMGRCREWHEVAEEKSKLVREIFEEIEKAHDECIWIDITTRIGYLQQTKFEHKLAELKKKYTEGEDLT